MWNFKTFKNVDSFWNFQKWIRICLKVVRRICKQTPPDARPAPSSDFDNWSFNKFLEILRNSLGKYGTEVSLSIVKELMHLKSDNTHLREQQNKVARNVRYSPSALCHRQRFKGPKTTAKVWIEIQFLSPRETTCIFCLLLLRPFTLVPLCQEVFLHFCK